MKRRMSPPTVVPLTSTIRLCIQADSISPAVLLVLAAEYFRQLRTIENARVYVRHEGIDRVCCESSPPFPRDQFVGLLFEPTRGFDTRIYKVSDSAGFRPGLSISRQLFEMNVDAALSFLEFKPAPLRLDRFALFFLAYESLAAFHCGNHRKANEDLSQLRL